MPTLYWRTNIQFSVENMYCTRNYLCTNGVDNIFSWLKSLYVGKFFVVIGIIFFMINIQVERILNVIFVKYY